MIAALALFAAWLSDQDATPEETRRFAEPGLRIRAMARTAHRALEYLVWDAFNDEAEITPERMSRLLAGLELAPDDLVIVLEIIEVDAPQQRRGIGAAALGEIEAWGRRHGARAVVLFASDPVPPMTFYRKQGYRILAQQWPDNAVMGKSLR